MLKLVMDILWVVIALGIVLGLLLFTLRWMNKKVPGMGGGTARMVKVLDRVVLGKNSSMVLVRVQDKVLLVAFTEHAVEKLAEFDDPEGKLSLAEVAATPSFAEALRDAAGKAGFGNRDKKNKANKKGEEE